MIFNFTFKNTNALESFFQYIDVHNIPYRVKYIHVCCVIKYTCSRDNMLFKRTVIRFKSGLEGMAHNFPGRNLSGDP